MIAAPALCISTASRSIPAWCRPSGAKVARSPRSRAWPQNGELHPMQKAFHDAQAFQCGYCTAGMIMTTVTLTDAHARTDLPHALKGNLCRCTGYRVDQRRAARQEQHRGGRGRQGTRRQPAQSVHRRHRDRQGALHDGSGDRGAAAPEGSALAACPCAHRLDRQDAALAVPGVVAVYTWEDVPKRLFSSALHEDHLVDPDDTYCSTTSRASSASGSRPWWPRRRRRPRPAAGRSHVEYEILPTVFDPVVAMRARRTAAARQGPGRPPASNIFCTLQGEIGDVAKGFKEADAVHEQTYSTSPRAARASRDARIDRLEG